MFKKTWGRFLKRMIIASGIYVLVLVIIFFVLWMNMDLSAVWISSQSILSEFAEKNRTQVETVISDMERLTYCLATAKEITDVLAKANLRDGPDNYFNLAQSDKRDVIRLIQMLTGADVGGKSITIVSERGDSVNLSTYADNSFSRQAVLDVSRLSALEELPLGKFLLPATDDIYMRTQQPMFSFVRKIADSYRTYGYVEVQDRLSTLDTIFSSTMDNFDTTNIILYQDSIFYASGRDAAEWSARLDALADSGELNEVTQLKRNGESFFLYKTRIRKHDLTLYSIVSMQYYYDQIGEKVRFIIIFALVVLVFMITVSIIGNSYLYRPIRDLRNRMENLKFDGRTMTLPVDYGNDELALFSRTFNDLNENIAKKNEELLNRRMRELEVSYRVLQSQVSPHFLHNTLTVIGLMGEQMGSGEIMDMCGCLSQMMAYSIDTSEESVTFSKEVEYMNDYLTLMKYRYLDRLEYSVHVDDALNQMIVPKFIMQPLVENCFTHGFKNSNKKTFRIRIGAKTTERGWEISIEDNGCGFTEESRRGILSGMADVRKGIAESDVRFTYNTDSIGLVNTYARLLLGMRNDGEIRLEIGASALKGGLVRIEFIRGETGADPV